VQQLGCLLLSSNLHIFIFSGMLQIQKMFFLSFLQALHSIQFASVREGLLQDMPHPLQPKPK